MSLIKQSIPFNFSQGLDSKTDPKQIPVGRFESLNNSIFSKGGLFQTRNGYGQLPSLPVTTDQFVTTFNGDLTAIGQELDAYSSSTKEWSKRGNLQPLSLDVLSLVKNNTSQTQVDVAIALNGLICTAYTDQNPANLSANIYKYVIADSNTGQNVIEPTQITSADATYGAPRVFTVGNYFIIVYTNKVGLTYHLKFIAISTSNPSLVSGPTDISNSYTPSSSQAFDAVSFNGSLYVAWNGASSSGIKMATVNSALSVSSAINPDSSHPATIISVAADALNNVIWVSYYNSGTDTGYTFARDIHLNAILSPHQIIYSGVNGTTFNMTSVAYNGHLTLVYESANQYSYDTSIVSNYLETLIVSQIGNVGPTSTLKRSVGLASKAFFLNGQIYCLTEYASPYQSTYFLIDINGNMIGKLAYGNGGASLSTTNGYLPNGLPNAIVNGNTVQIPYLYKDLLIPVNKNTNVPSGTQTNGIYAQTGINLASFTLDSSSITSAEIGYNLNLSGGFLWGYDGYIPTEQGFFLWPDSIEATWSTTGGSIAAKPDGSTNTNAYFYQVTYEWSDNQGNLFRSAPSIPIPVTTTGSGTSGSIEIYVPTLRLTYKTANPIKIVIYRWSVAQPVYYQVTSIEYPILNDSTTDSTFFVDTHADSSILANSILYTTGGVLENIGAPSFNSVFLFDDRLWGIDAEDSNLLWFSKTVLQATPVEMTDLQTIYVAPNIGAQGPTGSLTCGMAMDDKLILFKKSAINYINGSGPDATGSNDQYSQPVFVTSTVGCTNQKSIVFQPQGLMFEFQSEAGNQIWLLGRDLSTQYIGAPVEDYTQNNQVLSVVNIPGTNQVRFTMSNGLKLMYDYYYGQWGVFENVPGISSTLYQGVETFITSYGTVYQETPGQYLDGTRPVVKSFTTAWINFNQLQGYERAYYFYLLGTYDSPHILTISIAYDYEPTPIQFATFTPQNYGYTYGGNGAFGMESTYGGSQGTLENVRVFLKQQRCQAFQITIQEVYDPSYGNVYGKGVSLSGVNCVLGFKKGFRPIKVATSVGTS